MFHATSQSDPPSQELEFMQTQTPPFQAQVGFSLALGASDEQGEDSPYRLIPK